MSGFKHWFKEWSKQVYPHEKRVAFVARTSAAMIPLLARSWRMEIENEHFVADAQKEYGGVVVVTWHGRILAPIAYWVGRGFHALVSQSNDGDLLSAFFSRCGWHLIRGSTGRRAVEALRTGRAALSLPGTVLAIAADGPRGPAGIAKPGMTYFAQKTGKPVLPAGISARPRLVMKSWDRFQIPLPGARVCWVWGEPIMIAAGDDLDAATRRIQEAITALEAEADRRLGYAPMEYACEKDAERA